MKSLRLAIIILSLACTSCVKTDYANVLVTKVFDGDTLRLANGEKVRLLGIDTPEMYESDKLHRDAQRSGQDIGAIMALGRKSYRFTKQLVEGKRVRLEFDVQQRDKYGRLLLYVYVKRLCTIKDDFIWKIVHGDVFLEEHEDHGVELFVNAEIVKQGYAEPMIIPPNLKYGDYFQGLYQEARENKRGLWSNAR